MHQFEQLLVMWLTTSLSCCKPLFNCHYSPLMSCLGMYLFDFLFCLCKQCDMSSACLAVSNLLACGIVTIMCLPVLPQPTWQHNSRSQWWLLLHRSHRYNEAPHLIMSAPFCWTIFNFFFACLFTAPHLTIYFKAYFLIFMYIYNGSVSLKIHGIKHSWMLDWLWKFICFMWR